MKKLLRGLLATSLLAIAALAIAAEKAPKGSIRPAGTLKPAEMAALAKIPLGTALNAALAAVPGKVVKAELEVEDGCLMYSFEIVGADKKMKEVEIDAGNGKVLDSEDEENEKDEKKN